MKFYIVFTLLFLLISISSAQEFLETNIEYVVEKQKSKPFGIIECDKDIYFVKPGEKIIALCTVDVESINAVAVFDKIKAYETDDDFNTKKTLDVSEKIVYDNDTPLSLIDVKKTIKIEFDPKSRYGKFDVYVNVNKDGEIITEILDPYWVVDQGVQYNNPTTEYIGSRRFNISTEWNSNLTTYIKEVKFEMKGANTTVWNMNGLVAYWGFDEGVGDYAYDKSSNNKTGVLRNFTVSGWRNGIYGNAIEFNNDHLSYVDLGDDPNFEFNGKNITFLAWIYSNGLPEEGVIFSKYNTAGGNREYTFSVYVPHYNLTYMQSNNGLGTEGSYNVVFSRHQIRNNTWTFVGFKKTQYNSTHDNITLIINGETVRSSLFNSTVFAGTAKAMIGSRERSITIPDNTFNGTIDEIMLFNRSLSDEEINQIYTTKAHYFNLTFENENSVYISPWKSYACNNLNQCNVTLPQTYCDSGKYDYKESGKIYACNSSLGTNSNIRLFASYLYPNNLSSEYPGINSALVIIIIVAIGVLGYSLFSDINPIAIATGVVVFIAVMFLLTTVINITKTNEYPVTVNNENLGVFDSAKEFTTSYPIYSLNDVYAKNMISDATATLVFKNE